MGVGAHTAHGFTGLGFSGQGCGGHFEARCCPGFLGGKFHCVRAGKAVPHQELQDAKAVHNGDRYLVAHLAAMGHRRLASGGRHLWGEHLDGKCSFARRKAVRRIGQGAKAGDTAH